MYELWCSIYVTVQPLPVSLYLILIGECEIARRTAIAVFTSMVCAVVFEYFEIIKLIRAESALKHANLRRNQTPSSILHCQLQVSWRNARNQNLKHNNLNVNQFIRKKYTSSLIIHLVIITRKNCARNIYTYLGFNWNFNKKAAKDPTVNFEKCNTRAIKLNSCQCLTM